MERRIVWAGLCVLLFAGCEKAAENAIEPGVASAPVAEAAPVTVPAATGAVPDDVEKGVDPSVWDNEGEPEGETPGAEVTCEQEPLATYFFTLVGGNSVDNCGRTNPKVLAAFDALMVEAKPAESPDTEVAPLRQRLLSGPSGPGKPLQLQGQTWWLYSACQAHQCGTNQLVMLYEPTGSKMVGRLLTQCKVWWLGAPTAAQRALLDETSPVDPELVVEGVPCDE